jgi:hypothetical protein
MARSQVKPHAIHRGKPRKRQMRKGTTVYKPKKTARR